MHHFIFILLDHCFLPICVTLLQFWDFFFPENPPILELDDILVFGFIGPCFTLNKEHFKWWHDVCHCFIVLRIFTPSQSVTVAHLWIWLALFDRVHMKGVDDICASYRNGSKTIWTNHTFLLLTWFPETQNY